ncbi:phosphoglycerate dehydrogenase [Lipingzhangella sp. LS1_29]|uniref:D-3-phosphoglycerate dehydrogenase n=1 Tax=Lipingzhangella rawalii TaxID=2055835 RepID=A0ABU2H9K7_9ACTN|nr:phosphoglycerate dehydrogenase [Lipingzhangella rawalii]MDS1272005.1 phosphoglycerate dehydrogenase [Lipingzhangella rawalii]
MPKPVVLVAEELSPAALAVLKEDFDLRYTDGSDRSALLPALADVDAVIVRSATQIDAEALASAPKLQVVARAGVGLDNVDVSAATKAGVLVVNAPTSNIVSAAEQAINLLLACARHTAPAHNALVNGEWKRSKYTGVEIYDKVVGVVGLGRIGVLVAQRLAAFGVTLLAYDPFVQPARAAQLGVELVSLDELMRRSDFITVHLPKNKDTVGLISDDALAKAKPTCRVINAARGGIVDEDALVRALQDNRIAGAGVDVFAKEPCTDSPLFNLENVVVAPHLGASTHEAQEKAGTQVAESVKLALEGEFVPDAVNVQGGGVAEDVRPALPLTEKLGRIFTALAQATASRVDVEVRGEIASQDVKVLELAALKGVFEGAVEESVTFVNAPLLAEERGVEINLVTSSDSPDWRNVIRVHGVLPDGQRVSVSGTLSGPRQVEKVIEVNGYSIEVDLADHMAFFSYTDRPGIVGVVGQLLGDAQINIAGMQVSRNVGKGSALITLTVDSAVPDATLEAIRSEIGADSCRVVDLE